jgi:hypothetical protein
MITYLLDPPHSTVEWTQPSTQMGARGTNRPSPAQKITRRWIVSGMARIWLTIAWVVPLALSVTT